jgi:SAM-dependent methyltransferase
VKPVEYRRMLAAEEAQWWYVGQRAIAHAILEPALPAAGGPGDPGPRILDAGCGTGGNLVHLARLGRAVGVDLVTEATAGCRKRGVTAVRGEVLALPFPDRTFDVVTSFDVIYHEWVPDDGVAVAEMARVLRPGGLLLVRVPALKVLWGAHDEAVRSRHRYTRRELGGLLESRGLEILRSTYCNSLLFPLLLVRRTLDRLLGRTGSDVGFLPPALEWSFRHALLAEAALVRRGWSSPLGASVVALARRPPGPIETLT